MIKTWRQLTALLDVRSARERVMLLLAVLAVIYFIADSLLIAPLHQDSTTVKAEIINIDNKVKDIEGNLNKIYVILRSKPHQEIEDKIATVKSEGVDLQSKIDNYILNFVNPKKMLTVFKNLIEKQNGIKLLALKTNEPMEVVVAEENNINLNIYAHNLNMQFVGEYKEVVAYLKAIENLPFNLLWSSLQYEILSGDRVKINLNIVTLSTLEPWIQL